MPPLDSLPLFMTLTGKPVVVAGRTEMAVWKAELLLAAGAHVSLFGEDVEGARTFAGISDHPALELHERRWTPQDLLGAALAIAEQDDGFGDSARAAGVPFNIIDQPASSTVNFGTIVNRSPVVIGIGTGGGAPALGQLLRTRIEALIPSGLSVWAKQARGWRQRLKSEIDDFGRRRRFWQEFARHAFANSDRAPNEQDYDRLLDCDSERGADGRVIFAGSGPGDVGNVTLATAQALQTATVVLHDDLVSTPVLDLARREARRVSVGKRGGGPSCRQSDVNALLVELALAGESVVRLKGGDPLIFGRLAEELLACREAGIDATILPGVSAAQGAAASLGLSLTERHLARRVQFLTGHGSDGKLPSDIHWPAVADRSVTTVIYMPRRTLGPFVERALAAGLDPATPAVAVASATLPEEQRLISTVSELPDRVPMLPADAPTLVLIGEVVGQAGVGKLLATVDGAPAHGDNVE